MKKTKNWNYNVILSKAVFIIIDEATSVLDVENRRIVYEMIKTHI